MTNLGKAARIATLFWAISTLPVSLVGCSTSESTATPASTTYPGPDRSDVYPDITAPVKAATTQMSNEEAASYSARLSGLAAQRRSGAISEQEYRRKLAELEALATTHGPDTLKEIQN
ncbi:SHOCT domain-containing protein [Sinorhizobium sp. BG8]|uniref:SHOCT domain-containing protein n=1 Tax=Sinorhizobium sp. BG8 TaxID=2613773 RepID=UPI00193DB6DE|nr:SHOCT domain-containing protein [Sinorhizobium sp. BG8]QRM55390.1 SHOCT domain-containing protein [Sinorhizobium sp. BG8]